MIFISEVFLLVVLIKITFHYPVRLGFRLKPLLLIFQRLHKVFVRQYTSDILIRGTSVFMTLGLGWEGTYTTLLTVLERPRDKNGQFTSIVIQESVFNISKWGHRYFSLVYTSLWPLKQTPWIIIITTLIIQKEGEFYGEINNVYERTQ